MADAAPYRLIHGSALHMREVGDASVALVVTSPPFFSQVTEGRMRMPVADQDDLPKVTREVTTFTLGLRPAFAEISRVLVPGGHLVLETKDLRYGRALISLSCQHRELAEGTGLRLVSKVLWESTAESPQHGTLSRVTTELLGARGFRTVDTEEFLVFSKPGAPEYLGVEAEQIREESGDLFSPVWRTAPSRSWHPYPTPAEVVRRFVRLFTQPNDLVLDPFAGSGTVLRVAADLGRRALGYEIDREVWATAAGRPR